jgi:hypothetical protein
MRIRASILTTALLIAISSGACTHAGGKLMVDAPKMLPYQAPDIDEITGIDPDAPDEAPPPGAGSAQKPHK